MSSNLSSKLWRYKVAMAQPYNHLFQVQLEFEPEINSEFKKGTEYEQSTLLILKMPVWSPGSYLVREYAKHLQDFVVVNDLGDRLPWQKISKNQWQIEISSQPLESKTIIVSYQIYANELTVRTNHLDRSHGYFNGAAMFMYCEDFCGVSREMPREMPRELSREVSYEVEIVLPDPSWQIATSLPAVSDLANTFFASNFDILVDSPFEIGIHQRHDFVVLDKPHAWVIWGEGNLNIEKLIEDTKVIIEIEAQLFGGLPYPEYLFILHLSANGYGGLEHRNCCSLIFPRLGFRHDSYLRFLHLVAHEFFHTWNVKRLKPIELTNFDYEVENYTTSLWFCEGVTSYYDQLIPLRAGLCDRAHYLQQVSESITKLQLTPGRKVQTLAESSFDTWIKLYRPDQNSANSQISYYLKGEIVAMILDLMIRAQSNSSLDRVMASLWQKYGKEENGFSQVELLAEIELISGCELTNFWQAYLFGTEEIDYNFYFAPFGLTLQTVESSLTGFYTGMTLIGGNGFGVVKYVATDSPAQVAGINLGDELIAIDGIRVTADQFSDRLKLYDYGDKVKLTLFQQDLIWITELELIPPIGDRYILKENNKLTANQLRNLESWLGLNH
jgi:predicted metalloprotease with PDZ domain